MSKVQTFFKEPVEKDEKYKAFIRQQPCEECKQTGHSVAHHQPKKGESVMGGKVSDRRCIPLCRPHYWHGVLTEGCHGRYHRVGRDGFWQGRDPERIIDRLNKAYKEQKGVV